MILHFAADAIEVEESTLGVLVVGFYTEENYLMIQQNLGEYDAQDRRLGMNTYHIERDDQSFGGYGGVRQIGLSRDRLEVVLDETGIENLQCDGVRVDFRTDAASFALLNEKLGFIFGESLAIVN